MVLLTYLTFCFETISNLQKSCKNWIKGLIYIFAQSHHSGFCNYLSNVGQRNLPRSTHIPSYFVSSFFSLQQFFSLSSAFMTLIFLEIKAQLFCRLSIGNYPTFPQSYTHNVHFWPKYHGSNAVFFPLHPILIQYLVPLKGEKGKGERKITFIGLLFREPSIQYLSFPCSILAEKRFCWNKLVQMQVKASKM